MKRRIHRFIILTAVALICGVLVYHGYRSFRQRLEYVAGIKLLQDVYAQMYTYRTVHQNSWPADIDDWKRGCETNSEGVIRRLSMQVAYSRPVTNGSTNTIASVIIFGGKQMTLQVDGTILCLTD